MLKLIALNYNVKLNGCSQWLNIRGKHFYREISINWYQLCWPSVIKKMPLNKYKKNIMSLLFVH